MVSGEREGEGRRDWAWAEEGCDGEGTDSVLFFFFRARA